MINRGYLLISIVLILSVLTVVKWSFDSAHDARIETAHRMLLVIQANKECSDSFESSCIQVIKPK